MVLQLLTIVTCKNNVFFRSFHSQINFHPMFNLFAQPVKNKLLIEHLQTLLK